MFKICFKIMHLFFALILKFKILQKSQASVKKPSSIMGQKSLLRNSNKQLKRMHKHRSKFLTKVWGAVLAIDGSKKKYQATINIRFALNSNNTRLSAFRPDSKFAAKKNSCQKKNWFCAKCLQSIDEVARNWSAVGMIFLKLEFVNIFAYLF